MERSERLLCSDMITSSLVDLHWPSRHGC